MEGGGEDSEVASRGAVAAVEGGPGVEGHAALGMRAAERQGGAPTGLERRGEGSVDGDSGGGGRHGIGSSFGLGSRHCSTLLPDYTWALFGTSD